MGMVSTLSLRDRTQHRATSVTHTTGWRAGTHKCNSLCEPAAATNQPGVRPNHSPPSACSTQTRTTPSTTLTPDAKRALSLKKPQHASPPKPPSSQPTAAAAAALQQHQSAAAPVCERTWCAPPLQSETHHNQHHNRHHHACRPQPSLPCLLQGHAPPAAESTDAGLRFLCCAQPLPLPRPLPRPRPRARPAPTARGGFSGRCFGWSMSTSSVSRFKLSGRM